MYIYTHPPRCLLAWRGVWQCPSENLESMFFNSFEGVPPTNSNPAISTTPPSAWCCITLWHSLPTCESKRQLSLNMGCGFDAGFTQVHLVYNFIKLQLIPHGRPWTWVGGLCRVHREFYAWCERFDNGLLHQEKQSREKKRELPIYLGPLVYDVESLLERFGYSSGNGSTFDRSA